MSSSECEDGAEFNPLKSLDNDIETYVRFANTTERTVSLFWIGYDGKLVNYGTIRPREAMDMRTYVTHPWIVKDSANGSRLRLNGGRIFFPREHVDDIPFEIDDCDLVHIHIPVFTLLQRSAEVVSQEFGRDRLKTFNIPRELKETLVTMTEPSSARSYLYNFVDIEDGDENEN